MSGKDVTVEVAVGVGPSESGERGCEPRMQVASRSWRRQGNTSSLEPPEGAGSCQHLDFIP